MSKPSNIDLSKVKIGQRVQLRNGNIAILQEFDASDPLFTHKVNGNWCTKAGRLWINTPSQNDIIKILPLPKKKAVKKPMLKNYLQIKGKNEKTIRAAIKLLEGLLK